MKGSWGICRPSSEDPFLKHTEHSVNLGLIQRFLGKKAMQGHVHLQGWIIGRSADQPLGEHKRAEWCSQGHSGYACPSLIRGDTGSLHHTRALYLEKLREEIWRGGSGSSFCPQPGGDEADSHSR